MEDRLFKIEEVAKRMGVSRSWLYRKVQAGIIPHIKIGGMVRFEEKDLENWIQGHKIKGALKV